MRLFVAACVLVFALPGLCLAQEKTTKPARTGNGSSIIKHDSGASSRAGSGAALKGGSQQNDKAAGQPPAGAKQ